LITPRFRSLSIKGFRAYGVVEQTLNLPADIAVVWGPNSKGKTSLAEAFEFLLTGRITRRELMASSQDEFADALRNAHLADSEEVYVAARIIAADGTAHDIRRILTGDYGKKQDCTSRLEIDGATATEAGLAKLGIALSQPPLQAPVLAQHTLAYIFSVRPQDRATYFKTLLEVTDLDHLRNDIAALADDLKPLDDPLFTKFVACVVVTALKPALATLLVTVPDAATLTSRLEDAASALIEDAGEKVPDTLDERLAAIGRILADRRTKTFAVRGFERKELAGWNPPSADTWTRLDTYLEERKKVDEETRQLTALFDEALKLPAISAITEAVDCPLCCTESALTLARVQIIAPRRRARCRPSRSSRNRQPNAQPPSIPKSYALSLLPSLRFAPASPPRSTPTNRRPRPSTRLSMKSSMHSRTPQAGRTFSTLHEGRTSFAAL